MRSTGWKPEDCAETLKALADPIRLRIIDLLRRGAKNVGDLAEALDATIVTVSHHLGVLYHAGIVRRSKRGRFVNYSLDGKILVRSSQGKELLDLQCCRLELPMRRA
jgi:DNA-binding transcriptional ArsR family regulator